MTNDNKSGILLISTGDAYWILEGEDYLSAMLSDEEFYPKPVRMINYKSSFDLSLDLPDGISTGSLWGINPAIIERLRKLEDIIEEEK